MHRAATGRLFELFPALKTLEPEHFDALERSLQFMTLEGGSGAYHHDAECPSYLMCIDGLTRVFKTSENGRELLLYRVGPGGTCILTTQCLLTGGNFPAQSVAERETLLAGVPATCFHTLLRTSERFRRFVLDDYARLLTDMLGLVEELAFSSVDQRIARQLLLEAGSGDTVAKTHQQLANAIGTVREVVSRVLGEWERNNWVALQRGQVILTDPAALATYAPASGAGRSSPADGGQRSAE